MTRRVPPKHRDELAHERAADEARAHRGLRQPAMTGLVEEFAVAIANAWDAEDRDSVSRLLHVHGHVVELLRRAAAGEKVRPDVAPLYRVVTGRADDTQQILILILAVERVARRDDEELGAMLDVQGRSVPATDEQLCALVALGMRDDGKVAERLRRYPSDTANAVRAWRRRRGRPRSGEPQGEASKWAAIAALAKRVGLGDLTAESVEKTWRNHRPKIPEE